MEWKKGRERDRVGKGVGPLLENVRETDEGYIIACVRMTGDHRSTLPGGTFAYTLAWRKQLLHVVRAVPDRLEDKRKAFAEVKAAAEAHHQQQA